MARKKDRRVGSGTNHKRTKVEQDIWEQTFVWELIVGGGRNYAIAAEAAQEAAGKPPYKNHRSAYVTGLRFYHSKKGQELFRKELSVHLGDVDTLADRILLELQREAFVRLPDMMEIQEDGTAIFDFNLMTPDLAAAIGEYSVDTYIEGRGKDAREVKKCRIKLNNKRQAQDMLMKYLGMYQKDNAQKSLDDDLIERLNRTTRARQEAKKK